MYAVYRTVSIPDYAVADWIMTLDWSLVWMSSSSTDPITPRRRRSLGPAVAPAAAASGDVPLPASRDYSSAEALSRAVNDLDAATGSLRLRAKRAPRPLASKRPTLHRYSCCRIPGRQHLSGLAPTHHKLHQSLIARKPFKSDIRSAACRRARYC